MENHWHLNEEDFFTGLPEIKSEFLSCAHKHGVRKRGFIFFEGDPGNSCFYLEKGTVRIFRISSMGKEPIFFVRKPGEIFGVAEVINGKARKCNAQAVTASVLYEIEQEALESLLAAHYPLARRVIEVLGRRLRYLGEQVTNLMVSDLSTRLLKTLVYLSYPELVQCRSWEKPISVPIILTQELLAACTGSCQQTVSETLKKLQEEGVIFVSKKQITLLKPLEALDLICH